MRQHLLFTATALMWLSGTALAQSPFDLISRTVEQMNNSVVVQMKQVHAAEARAAELKKQADAAEQQAIAQASQNVKAIVEEAQAKVQQAEATVQQVSTVSDDQRKVLLAKLAEFNGAAKRSAQTYGTASMALVALALTLSLGTAMAGFMNWSKVAGGLSILVASLIAVPKAIPINERATYYRILDSQSYSTLVEAELRLTTAVEDYNESLRQLKVLILYEAEKYPAGGDIGDVTRGLIDDLKVKPTQVAER